jgi:fructokinase
VGSIPDPQKNSSSATDMTPSRDPIKRLLSAVFPHRTVVDYQVLSGGLINTNIKILFASFAPVVLRIYRDGAAVCKKELAIHDLLKDSVPVARVIHAEPSGLDSPPFAVLEFVEGITFQQLKQSGDLTVLQQASAAIGRTLAKIGRLQFHKSGRLLAEKGALTIGEPFIEGPDPIPGMLDRFLSSSVCQRRLGTQLADRVHKFGWDCASLLPDLDEQPALVHSDFGSRNILVHQTNGYWDVAAVLDWEFAFSGSPLLDVGHFIRYERVSQPLREPHFSRAFVENGGRLPDNWREIVRVIDLTGLVHSLTHEDLPLDVEAELIELITATVDHRIGFAA